MTIHGHKVILNESLRPNEAILINPHNFTPFFRAQVQVYMAHPSVVGHIDNITMNVCTDPDLEMDLGL